jgi:hypothetical protein
MEEQQVPRTEPTHKNVNLMIPVNAKIVMAKDEEVHGESCFGWLWNMQNKACGDCHDNVMCGIVYSKRVKKSIKDFEAVRPAMLDTVDFDGINRKQLMLWLKLGERTLDDMIEHVTELSKCADAETVRLWCRSFIKDSDKIGLSKGVIYFR